MKLYFKIIKDECVHLKIVKGQFGEYVRRFGVEFLWFRLYFIAPYRHINLCYPSNKSVSTNGMVLVTESDEQDQMYVTNRNRGFEISYHGYEIKLYDGELRIYRYDEISPEDASHEDVTLNEKLIKITK